MVRLGVAKLAARRGTFLKLAAAAIVAIAWAASPANAEMQIGVYGGWNGSFDSDIHLVQPGGTNMTLDDVPWDGDSFGAPPYWGIRGTYWFNNAPNWGFMIDYHHAKVIADQGAVVSVSGTRDGIPVAPKDRVGSAANIAGSLPGGRPMWAWASALPSRMSRFAERLARPIRAPSTISSTA